MMRFSVLLISTLTVWQVAAAATVDDGGSTWLEGLVRGRTPAELDEAVEAGMEERVTLVTRLIRMLTDDPPPEKKARICCALGFLRSGRAAGALAECITLRVPPDSGFEDRHPLWARWPAQEALVRIGTPSLRHMIFALEKSTDDHARVLYARVIWEVFGRPFGRPSKGKPIGRQYVRTAIDRQKDPTKKARLREALKYFE